MSDSALTLKQDLAEFWNRQSCGEVYAAGESLAEQYDSQARVRYELEPFIEPFARFPEACDRDLLEIGVGMGADHARWAEHGPRSLHGIDLTERAIAHTRQRLQLKGLDSNLQVADAEHLPFDDESFDLVYSWGVLHHSPNTPRAIEEVYRVLRPGGVARIMIYHKHSVAGCMLWTRYALLRGRPWRSLADVYHHHLESPGTKAYSLREARDLLRKFSAVELQIELSIGDLLEGEAGQRHRGTMLSLAKRFWPRSMIRRFCSRYGLFLLIEARK